MPYQQHHVAPYTATGFPSEFGNIFDNMAKGYGYANLPKDIMLRQEADRLKNALSKEELKYAPQMNSARLGLMGEQIKQLRMETDPNAYLNYVNALMNGMNSNQGSNGQLVSQGKAGAPSFSGAAQQQVDPNEIPPEYRGSQADNQMLQQALQQPNTWQQNQQLQQSNGMSQQSPMAQQPSMNMRDMLIRKKLGLPMETPQEIEQRSLRTEFAKDLNKKDIETAEQFSKDYIAATKAEPTIKELSNLANTPVFKEMRNGTNLIAPNLSLGYYKKWGSPEQKELAGTFESTVNKFVTDSKDIFGARMTDRDLRFLQSMKVNEGDSIEAMQGKLKGISMFNEAMKQRAEFSDILFRAGRTPIQATKEANKMIDMTKIEEQVRKDLNLGTKKNIPLNEVKAMNQETFQSYYRSLSPEARATLRRSLGN